MQFAVLSRGGMSPAIPHMSDTAVQANKNENGVAVMVHTEPVVQPEGPEQASRRWLVLMVEDDPAMRARLQAIVDAHPSLHLLAACDTRAAALAWIAAAQQAPDVLLVDLGLPDGSGLDVLQRVVQRFPGCDCMVISMFGDAQTVVRSIEAGAVGYLYKDAAPVDIAQAILDMKAGASPISPAIARHLARRLQTPAETVDLHGPAPVSGSALTNDPTALSPREGEVLQLIGKGFSFSEIAGLQGVSVHTVRTHIKGIYRKLAVHSRGEAVYEATRAGILSLGSPDD